MTDLPRPDVTVTHATERDPNAPPGSVDVVISRDGKAKSYRATGDSGPTIVADAVKQIISDPRTAEWLPRSGEKK